MNRISNQVIVSITCPPLYADFTRMQKCIKCVNSLHKKYKLNSIVEDLVNDVRIEVNDDYSLFLLAHNELLRKRILILSCNGNIGSTIELTHNYRISNYEWPKREYSAIDIKFINIADINNELLLKFMTDISEILYAFKIVVHHPLITISALQQRKYCVNCNFVPPYNLQELPHLHLLKIDEYNFPAEINWMGYWNKSIVNFLGLDKININGLFYRIRKTINEGIIYQLSKDYVSEKNMNTIALLKKAYDVIPKAGGRTFI